MKAIRFYALLEAAYRVQAEDTMRLINAVGLAMADRKDKLPALEKIRHVADGIMPGESADDYSGLETLKKVL